VNVITYSNLKNRFKNDGKKQRSPNEKKGVNSEAEVANVMNP